jgi:hypothetical protein
MCECVLALMNVSVRVHVSACTVMRLLAFESFRHASFSAFFVYACVCISRMLCYTPTEAFDISKYMIVGC